MWKWILFIVLLLAGSCVGTGYWLQSSGKLKELQEKYQPGAQAAKAPANTAESMMPPASPREATAPSGTLFILTPPPPAALCATLITAVG